MKNEDLKRLEKQRSNLIKRLESTKDPETREQIGKEIDRMSEIIKNYAASRNTSQEGFTKWLGLGIQAAGVGLPLWLTNKWNQRWTLMENGDLKRNGIRQNPPTTRIPMLSAAISKLFPIKK